MKKVLSFINNFFKTQTTVIYKREKAKRKIESRLYFPIALSDLKDYTK